MTETATTEPRRRRVALSAVGIVALLSLGACTSDPGPKRVAQDIIKAEALANPNLDEQCMLDALDEFSSGDLETIAEQVESENADTVAAGQVELDAFQSALEACN